MNEIQLFEVVTITLDESIGSRLLYRKFKYQTSELQLFLQHVPVLYWYPHDIIGRNIKYDIIDACLFKSVMRNNFHDYSNMDMINTMLNDEMDLDNGSMEISKQKLKRLLDGLFDDELFILQELEKCQQGSDYNPVQYASNRLKDDEQFMLKATEINGCALEYASDRLRNDERLIKKAAKQQFDTSPENTDSEEIDNDTIEPLLEEAIKYGRSLDDEQFTLEAVKKYGCSLEYVSDRLRDNEKIVLAAVRKNSNALDLASDRLRDNEEIVLEAIKHYGHVLFFASTRLRDNEQIVLEAVKQHGDAFAYASNRLKDNENIALEAVKETSLATNYASQRLKDDESFILQAVKQNGNALEYASDRLKDNETIVLEAVKQSGDSLFHASNRLRNDFNFANEIFKYCNTLDVFEGFGKELRNIEFIYYYIENNLSRFHELIRGCQ